MPGDVPYWGSGGVIDSVSEALFDEPLVLLGEDGAPFFERGRDVAFVLDGPAWVNNHIHVLRPKAGVNRRFLVYALNAVDYAAYITGSTRDKLTQDDMWEIRLPLMSADRQQAIADYLDAETKRIDTLIHVERHRLGLAYERLVSATQARVLGRGDHSQRDGDPLGPLHPTPTHWEMRRNKTFLREIADLSTSGNEELLTVSHITGVTPRSEKDVTMFLAETNEGYKRVMPGDLVVNTMWAWMGALGVSSYEGIVSPAYGVYRFTDQSVSSAYFDALFRSPAYVAEMTRYSKGVWTSRLRLYPESFLSLRSPFPPTHEQHEIADRVVELQDEAQRLSPLLEQSVALLTEHRHSLIAAAVTGEFEIVGAAA